MSHPLRLENFDAAVHAEPDPTLSLEEAERQRLEAYDSGYALGWKDASDAAAQEQARLSSELAEALQALDFTFHEARAHVLLGVAPFLKRVCDTLLPEILRETLGARIQEELSQLAADAADAPVELLVPDSDLEALREVLPESSDRAIRLVAGPDLPQGTLYLQLGTQEREIDLTGLTTRLGDALTALETVSSEVTSHG
ncbi:flagellar assembly protein FliH [Tranquillimonas rosea]|uniref:Flagellar assembly protein FliH n=1 Tax=Tranquillimonas rosea TaxID=641238 RepID=A0A1H9UCD3_9RHOB|nr:hypothetical protein [Tranquillimonas rosea]SES06992.1 flagellar assembly protein FliH [Tranquillimonas rosea]